MSAIDVTLTHLNAYHITVSRTQPWIAINDHNASIYLTVIIDDAEVADALVQAATEIATRLRGGA